MMRSVKKSFILQTSGRWLREARNSLLIIVDCMPDNEETLLAKKLGQAEPFYAIFFVFTEYVAFLLVVLNSSYTFASRYLCILCCTLA